MQLVLASTSPYRRGLLARLLADFEVASPGDAEEAVESARHRVSELALARARAKAEAVAREHPEALVLGSDQVCALGDEILRKPGSAEANREQLGRLSGRTHALWTAVVLRGPHHRDEHVEEARLRMRELGDEEIARYVARDAAHDCAGGYKLESAGIALFESIATGDFTGIEGLPLLATARLLRAAGLELP